MREREQYSEETPVEIQPHSRKEAEWIKKEKDVEEISGIEGGIVRIIVALNLFEILTSQSCEGHIVYQENETGIVLPCVEISAPDQPEKRFVGQEKIIKKVAKKYGLLPEDVKTTILHNAHWQEFRGLKETQNYEKWRQENKEIAKKADLLLKDFYKDSTTPEHVRLVIHEKEAGQFDIYNLGGSQGHQPVGEKDLTPEQKSDLQEQLARYQEEMNIFAESLKQKYIS